jgi:hypothetical protein
MEQTDTSADITCTSLKVTFYYNGFITMPYVLGGQRPGLSCYLWFSLSLAQCWAQRRPSLKEAGMWKEGMTNIQIHIQVISSLPPERIIYEPNLAKLEFAVIQTLQP